MSPPSQTLAVQPRREPRFTVSKFRTVTATVTWSSGESTQALQAEVLDVSRTGARLCLTAPLPPRQNVEIKVEVDQLQLVMQSPGEVRWSRLGKPDSWYVGCSLTDALEPDVLEQLASSGYLERRQEDREPVALTASGRWELSPATMSVTLQNISRGGFCMIVPRAGQPGERFLLEFQPAEGKAEFIRARVQWTRQEGEQCVYGCQYASDASYDVLRRLAQAAAQGPPRPSIALHRPWRFVRWVGRLVVRLIGISSSRSATRRK